MTNDDQKERETDSKARRPYQSPKLRALGSVREVTWGGSPTSIEGAFMGQAQTKMM